jgi:hypothetical protein
MLGMLRLVGVDGVNGIGHQQFSQQLLMLTA